MEKTAYTLAALTALGAWAAWIAGNDILTCALALASVTTLAVCEELKDRKTGRLDT